MWIDPKRDVLSHQRLFVLDSKYREILPLATHQFGHCETVVGLDLVQKGESVVLHHLVLGRYGLLNLIHPPSHHLYICVCVDKKNADNDQMSQISPHQHKKKREKTRLYDVGRDNKTLSCR